MGSPRLTLPTRLVLQALLETDEEYGAQIGRVTHLPSGTVHPILARLEGFDWVESRWEDVDPASEGRPARRYYRLTRPGRMRARAALDRVGREVRLTPTTRRVEGLS